MPCAGAHPYSEWGSTAKDSDDEEDVAAGVELCQEYSTPEIPLSIWCKSPSYNRCACSEPEAGADDDDDDDKTLVEELDPSVSLQQLLKQQKQ
eukprot:scaffold207844_cov24-Tisochrysis_lutea.AAC.2